MELRLVGGRAKEVKGCKTATRRRHHHQQYENIKCIASGWSMFQVTLGDWICDSGWGGVRQRLTCTWQHAHTRTHEQTDKRLARSQRKCCRYLCDKRKTQAAVAWCRDCRGRGGADGNWAQINIGLGIVMLAKLCDSDSHLQRANRIKHHKTRKQTERTRCTNWTFGRENELKSIKYTQCGMWWKTSLQSQSSQAERLEIEVDRAFTPFPFPTRESV